MQDFDHHLIFVNGKCYVAVATEDGSKRVEWREIETVSF